MTRHVAFLRGVNLGKRSVKSADLKAAFEAMGFAGVKTLLASGNVVFEADPAAVQQTAIESALEAAFGFPIGTVLRRGDEIAAMIDSDPFGRVPEGADVKRYVMLFDVSPVPRPALVGVPGDFDVTRIDEREIYLLAYRLENGRYGEGMDGIEKQLGKGLLVTTRNWNTIIKAAA